MDSLEAIRLWLEKEKPQFRNVKEIDNSTLELEFECLECHGHFKYECPKNNVLKWINGSFIQHAFSHLTIDDREIFLSGYCSDCFDKLFPPEPSDSDFWNSSHFSDDPRDYEYLRDMKHDEDMMEDEETRTRKSDREDFHSDGFGGDGFRTQGEIDED